VIFWGRVGMIFKPDLQPLVWASHHQFVGKIMSRDTDTQMPFAAPPSHEWVY
jgi:hypothetical protein